MGCKVKPRLQQIRQLEPTAPRPVPAVAIDTGVAEIVIRSRQLVLVQCWLDSWCRPCSKPLCRNHAVGKI
jgi:hypothetical protein